MQAISIDFFRPEDAPGVARLFRQVYGEGYPIEIYYHPERLIEENTGGRVLSSVAHTQAGEIVGHDAALLKQFAMRGICKCLTIFQRATGRGPEVMFHIRNISEAEAKQQHAI